jgi:hypothetical protein
MKINEIEYGHWNSPSWAQGEPRPDAIFVGEFDCYKIYSQDDYYFVPDSDFSYLGYVKVEETGEFRELYVPEKNRRRGIASSIVLFIVRELKSPLTLTASEIVTDDSRSVFYTLAQAGKISITEKGLVLTKDQISQLFTDISDNDRELVIESQRKKKSTTCNELVNPVTGEAVAESIYFGPRLRPTSWFD